MNNVSQIRGVSLAKFITGSSVVLCGGALARIRHSTQIARLSPVCALLAISVMASLCALEDTTPQLLAPSAASLRSGTSRLQLASRSSVAGAPLPTRFNTPRVAAEAATDIFGDEEPEKLTSKPQHELPELVRSLLSDHHTPVSFYLVLASYSVERGPPHRA